MSDKKRPKGAKEAAADLMRMLADNDDYLDNLKKNKDKQKKIVEKDKKRKHKPKKKSTSSISQELGEVIPDLKRGVKREYKKIKAMFKKDK